MRTLWPPRVSSSTPTGIMATRYSSVLISLGTPITYLPPAVMGSSRYRVRGRTAGILGQMGETNQGEYGASGSRNDKRPAIPYNNCDRVRPGGWDRPAAFLKEAPDALRSLHRPGSLAVAHPQHRPGQGDQPGRGPRNLAGHDQDRAVREEGTDHRQE